MNHRAKTLFAAAMLAAALLPCLREAVAAPLTTTTLAVTNGSTAVAAVTSGTVVTLTAAVVKSGTTAVVTPGLVRFCDSALNAYCQGSALLGTAQLNAKGIAVLKLRLGLGTHTITAVFAGKKTEGGSTSAAKLLEVQGEAGSVTTLGTSQTAAAGSYILSTSVAAMGAGALAWPPTGTVSFLDASNANASLGTSALNPGSGGYGMSFVASWNNYASVQAVGDFNGDGYADFIGQYFVNGTAYSYSGLGNGEGGFNYSAALPSLPQGSEYRAISVADFNGDGIPDLLATIQNSGSSPATLTFEVLLGNGDGSFNAGTQYGGTQYNSLGILPLVGDFNSDGLPDVIWYFYASETPNAITSDLEFYAGSGNGSFATPVDLGGGMLFSEVADFNNDGKLDLIGPDQNENAFVALGNGDGSFQAPLVSVNVNYTNKGSGGLNAGQEIIADFNGDGVLDIAGFDGVTAFIAYGNGDGTFGDGQGPYCVCNTTQVSLNPAGNGGSDLYSADLNGDGLPDLFQFPETGGIFTYLNNGDGTFTSETQSISGLAGEAQDLYAVADVNGDGLPDIFAYGANLGGLSPVLLNTGGWVSQGALTSVALGAGSGKHEVKASFGGDPGTMASSGSERVALWAPKIATTLAVTSSLATVAPGGIVKLTATLTPSTSGTLSTKGELVGFYSGSTLIGSAPLTAGVAVLATKLPGGSDALTAIYSGDNSFNGATSAAIQVKVTALATTLTLTTSAATATAFTTPGVTLTAKLSPFAAAPLTTNGELVTFYDGKTWLGTGALTGGVAILSAGLPVGSDSLTATYAGDANFDPANSAAAVVKVTKEPTSMTLTSSPATVGLGLPVTLTATLSAANAAGYPNPQSQMPGEGIWFYNGAELLGWEYVQPGATAGTASASIQAYLPIGTDSVTAVYSGDATFLPSTGLRPVKVTKNATTLTLALVNSCAYQGCEFIYPGDSVTLAATLSGFNFNNAAPGGENVVFYDGATAIGKGQLVYGSQAGCSSSLPCATFTTTSLPNGTGSLTAVYAGDAQFFSETSNAVIAKVGKGATTTTFTAFPTSGFPGAYVQLTATTTSSFPGDTYFGDEGGNPSVSFYDGTNLLGTGTFAANGNCQGSYPGIGSCEVQINTSPLSAGTHSITAVFNGDAAYRGSTSGVIKVTREPAATTTTLTASPASGVAGTQVTLGVITSSSIASDENFNNEAGNDTVSFYNGTKLLGTTTFDASGTCQYDAYPGVGSCYAQLVVSNLPAGTSSITAVYSGDSDYRASTSAAVKVSLQKTGTSTALLIGSSTICGGNTTLNAQVTSAVAGDPNFAGYAANDSVSFYTTTGILLGTLKLQYGGQPGLVYADLTTTKIPCDGVYLYATYGGDAAYTGSTSTKHYLVLGNSAAIEWPEPEPIAEGVALTSQQLNAKANVDGTYAYSPKAGTVLPKGTHRLTVDFNPSAAAAKEGYVATKKAVTLTVE